MNLLPIAAIALAAYLFHTWYHSPKGKGMVAEWMFTLFLRVNLSSRTYRILSNISLRLPDKSTTQIDHIVVSPFGIFVIELKNYQGWIFGSEKGPVWTQTLGRKKKYTFQNPIRQNYRHVMALSELMGIPPEYFKPIVAFVGGCEIKTIDELPPNAKYTGNAIKYIKEQQTRVIQDQQVPEIVDAIKAWKNSGNVSSREHIRNLKKQHNTQQLPDWMTIGTEANNDTKICPKCGKPMIARTAGRGSRKGQQFWGCTGYPTCRHTEDI